MEPNFEVRGGDSFDDIDFVPAPLRQTHFVPVDEDDDAEDE